MAAFASLAACDSSKVVDTLGLSRSAPDEFAVIARPPLSVPPEFDLRPPSNTPLDNSEDAANKARNIIKGQEGQSIQSSELPAGMTRAEQNLLVKAGQEKIDPTIREKLAADAEIKKEKKKEGMMDRLLGKSDKEDEPVVKVEPEKKEEPKEAAPEEVKQPAKSE